MINQIKYYIGTSEDPYYNLAVEQHLLETVEDNCCILYLWQNKNTVVIGRNQNAWKECRTAELETDGVHLARRLSGGGAVFHDLGNLNFTFLVPTADYDLDKQLGVIIEACRALGISAEKSGRNDILADGRKFSGNAFYEHENRSYHHGTMLIDVDMSKMSKYLNPSTEKLNAKGVDSIRSRVVNLKELCPALNIDEMKRQMTAAFERVYGLRAKRIFHVDFDATKFEEIYHHNKSWEWNYGKNLPFTLEHSSRFNWGEIQLQMAVDSGIITDVTVYSDAMDWDFAKTLQEVLIGCRFQTTAMIKLVQTINCSESIRNDICQMLLKQEV